MDDYERRAHFAHRFGTPLTTLQASIEMLDRYFAEAPIEPRMREVLDLLQRASARLERAADFLYDHIVDARDGITVHIPDAALLSSDRPIPEVQRLKLAKELPACESPAPASPRTVLIIEDSPTYRAIMTAHLEHNGYRVLQASDGFAGIDLARDERPDAILIDMVMPEVSGAEIAAILRDDPETKDIPLVICTSLELEMLSDLDARLLVVRKDDAIANVTNAIEYLIQMRDPAPTSQILIIEDDSAARQDLVAGLAEIGYTVTTAASGSEGLARALHQPFDLILLDLLLPDLDGWTVLRMIRERTHTALTPVIVLSALNQPPEKVRGLQLGADDYVSKPFDWDELLARISAVLRRRELEGSANPSTMLPGNKAIERAINERIQGALPFAVGYCDLDHFKAYNDTYGFLKGDAVIHHTARIILSAIERHGARGDFVGHIGGDDFVFICDPAQATNVCETIIHDFDTIAPLLYDADEREQGYIEQFDRHGIKRVFPFVSISIAVVTNVEQPIAHMAEVGDLAAELKKRAKARSGSAYLIEGGLP